MLERDKMRGSVMHFIAFSVRDLKSKKDSKDQESIQSSTTPVQGYQMGK